MDIVRGIGWNGGGSGHYEGYGEKRGCYCKEGGVGILINIGSLGGVGCCDGNFWHKKRMVIVSGRHRRSGFCEGLMEHIYVEMWTLRWNWK